MNKKKMGFLNWSMIAKLLVVMAGVFFANEVMALTTVTISGIGKNIGTSIGTLAKILQDVALVSGVGFILAAFFKFHAHKNNPQQVPLSHGITLLLIGAGLAVFPHLIDTATKGVFGTNAGGGGISSIVASGLGG